MKRPLDGTRLVMGTDYYPEQWDPSLWDEDLRRMRETGIEVIRIAEFAWNIFSPRGACSPSTSLTTSWRTAKRPACRSSSERPRRRPLRG